MEAALALFNATSEQYFDPKWFLRYKVLSKWEAENAEGEIDPLDEQGDSR